MANAQFCPVCGDIISDGCPVLDADGNETNEITYSPCACDTAARQPDAAPVVGDEDLQNAYDNAMCDWHDWEKAEQGFGPLDIGWLPPDSPSDLDWWFSTFLLPQLRAAIEQAKGGAE